ncbi:MAG: hypothetical protein CM15mV74_090 [uncultured marine virus]|nr:MAG: hypothetical protein CM15mV74_090 [uncultured marine virus]
MSVGFPFSPASSRYSRCSFSAYALLVVFFQLMTVFRASPPRRFVVLGNLQTVHGKPAPWGGFVVLLDGLEEKRLTAWSPLLHEDVFLSILTCLTLYPDQLVF